MVGPVGRLKGFIELMVGHVMVELVSDSSFQDFTKEGKVGDWPVVVEVNWVKSGFLQNGGD